MSHRRHLDNHCRKSVSLTPRLSKGIFCSEQTTERGILDDGAYSSLAGEEEERLKGENETFEKFKKRRFLRFEDF